MRCSVCRQVVWHGGIRHRIWLGNQWFNLRSCKENFYGLEHVEAAQVDLSNVHLRHGRSLLLLGQNQVSRLSGSKSQTKYREPMSLLQDLDA